MGRVESEAHPCRPSTSLNEESGEKVWWIVMEERHVTIQEIVHDVEIITGSVNSLLTEDLSIRRLSEKFTFKVLAEHNEKVEILSKKWYTVLDQECLVKSHLLRSALMWKWKTDERALQVCTLGSYRLELTQLTGAKIFRHPQSLALLPT